MECDFNIKQELSTSCAVKCQQIILRDYGIDVSEKDLRKIACQQGWFDDNVGMYMHDNGKLLGCFGVGYNHSQNNNLQGIMYELQQQHRVMVNVNKLRLYSSIGETFKNLHDEACHAVIVTKVINDDCDNGQILITNPSTGHVNEKISVRDFSMAWKDSEYYMLATSTPAQFEYDPVSKSMITIH